MILAFVLIGMVGNAQERVSMDSVQVGDDLIFDKTCKGIWDAVNGSTWTIPPSKYKVTTLSYSVDDWVSHIVLVNDKGEFFFFDREDIKRHEKKKRLHFCR
ncbi:MAG: hypothetical protein ACP5N7_04200 [Candidatus Pacearchaeota archaeon]